jgi:membrane protein
MDDFTGRSWQRSLRRAVAQVRPDELTDRAAALTYYGVQAIFPALLVLISILSALGHSTTQTLIDNIGTLTPGGVRTVLQTIITNAQHARAKAGIAGVIGLVLALWSASGYVAGFTRSANAIYAMPEGRPIWKTAPIRLGLTVFTMVSLVAGLIIVVVTGSVADKVGKVLGIGSTAVTVWDIAKWPVLLLLLTVVVAVLYWAAPNVRQPRFRWISPGAALAIGIWLLASGLFAVYVASFGSYNKTYGTFAGIIIFLVWLWITNLALLLGLEVNAERERERALRQGVSEKAEPFAVPRDTRKFNSDQTAAADEVARRRAPTGRAN